MTAQNASAPLLSDEQVRCFNRDGYLHLPGFYDLETEIHPVQQHIYKILGILLKKHGISVEQPPFSPETFDVGYRELITKDRRYGSEVYDAVKHMPAFVRLTCCEKHDQLMKQLRETDMPGMPIGGSGIRIDNPNEEKFRSNWHQDYPGQFRSIDGLVYWSPLVPITQDIGPLQVALGSHRDGLRNVLARDPENPEKTGVYALRLHNESEVLEPYEKIHALAMPGDLLVLDYLTLHASGFNRSDRSRWSMQMRYFNYRDPVGQSYGWAGSFAAGTDIRTIHPELIVT